MHIIDPPFDPKISDLRRDLRHARTKPIFEDPPQKTHSCAPAQDRSARRWKSCPRYPSPVSPTPETLRVRGVKCTSFLDPREGRTANHKFGCTADSNSPAHYNFCMKKCRLQLAGPAGSALKAECVHALRRPQREIRSARVRKCTINGRIPGHAAPLSRIPRHIGRSLDKITYSADISSAISSAKR